MRLRLALATCCLIVAPAAAARAEVTASLHPSFRPDALGARTAFTLSFALGVGEEGVPPPVTHVTLRLPAGLGVDLHGVATCSPEALRRKGRAGCSPRSLIGRGHAVVEVHAGSQAIPEEALVWAFRGTGQGAVEILSRGETPLQQQTLSSGALSRDGGPYGLRLAIAVPRIPTLVYEPDGSIISYSLTIGAAGSKPRAHAAGVAITVPRHCPAGGFPFAAEFTFADFTTARASASVPCP